MFFLSGPVKNKIASLTLPLPNETRVQLVLGLAVDGALAKGAQGVVVTAGGAPSWPISWQGPWLLPC